MMTDSFRNDLIYFIDRIKNDEPFSLSRWADGELAILQNRPVSCSDGWSFNPIEHAWLSNWLMQAYIYEHKDYFKGISCPCCDKIASDWYRDNNPLSPLTWSNIFVNSNFSYFNEHFWKAVNESKRLIVLIANEKINTRNIPFKIDHIIEIEDDTAFYMMEHAKIFKDCVGSTYGSNKIFLFAAGPLSNCMIHRLIQFNPDNFYIDIGSTLNNAIRPNSRDYLSGGSDLQKTCIW